MDIGGVFSSQGFNLIGKADGSIGLTNGINNDLVGTIAAPLDPRLGPLQDNGGPTFTHALLPGSPVIDRGKSFGIVTDQRGHQRPYDYASIPNAPGGDGSDIGAFELDTPVLSITRLSNRTLISWDANSSGYTLECTTNPSSSTVWAPVAETSSLVGGQYQIVDHDSPAAGIKFFRLRKD